MADENWDPEVDLLPALGKGPRNSFFVFCSIERLTQSSVNPNGKKLTQKVLGKMWRSLSQVAKRMYQELALGEFIEFQTREEQYWADNPVRRGEEAEDVSHVVEEPLPRRSLRILNKSRINL